MNRSKKHMMLYEFNPIPASGYFAQLWHATEMEERIKDQMAEVYGIKFYAPDMVELSRFYSDGQIEMMWLCWYALAGANRERQRADEEGCGAFFGAVMGLLP